MRALTFQGKRTVRVESVDEPKLVRPTDALVAVRLAGVCGSDLHVYHEREAGLDHGTVMGHEYVGEIVETGAEVDGLRVGDRVLGPFSTSCGRCFYCRRGLTARCVEGQLFGWVEGGVGLQGTQAEFARIPLASSTLVAVPDEIDDDVALLLGDIAATGYYCARQAGIEPDGVYAVVGCGPVGLMAILCARELGAQRLFAIDSVPERLAHAVRLGARSIDYKSANAVELLREATDGRGADAVLEVVGSESATRLAYALVRPGGVVSAVGVHTEPHIAFTPAEAYDKNLTYRVGRCPARALLDDLLPLARRRAADLISVVSHRLSLEQGAEAYEMFDLKRDGCTKVVLGGTGRSSSGP